MRLVLSLLIFLIPMTLHGDWPQTSPLWEPGKKRVVDIYIQEQKWEDGLRFYCWITDPYDEDFIIEKSHPDISIGWLQGGSLYLGSRKPDNSYNRMVMIYHAKKDDNPNKSIIIKFSKWGDIDIHLPVGATAKVHRSLAQISKDTAKLLKKLHKEDDEKRQNDN